MVIYWEQSILEIAKVEPSVILCDFANAIAYVIFAKGKHVERKLTSAHYI